VGRRDRDDRPPIEIVGGEPAITSVQQVSTGRSGSPRKRFGGLVAAVAVLAVLAAGVAFGGDGDGEPATGAPAEEQDEETTTSRRRTTTTRPRGPTTTTTVAPLGPLFAGQGLRGWLLSGNPEGWTLVEIATGAVSEPVLPFDDPYSTKAVTGGVVTIQGGHAEYHDLRIPEDAREPVSLGPADQVLAAARPDQVWLLAGLYDGPTGAGSHARLVDLTGRDLRAFPIPEADYSAATSDGLLFERGGRVFVVDETGPDALAVGQLVGAVGSSVLTMTCDERAACGVDLLDRSGERVRRLDIEGGRLEEGVQVSADERGRFAVIAYGAGEDGSDLTVALFDTDGTSIASVASMGGYINGPISWLPGDAGLVTSLDGRIAWIHGSADGWIVDEVELPRSIQSDGVLAIVS
jgi:hypothetical protein